MDVNSNLRPILGIAKVKLKFHFSHNIEEAACDLQIVLRNEKMYVQK